MQQGTVIKSTGSWYQVRLENGQVLECRIVGKFRLGGLKLTNPVAVGDLVQVEAGDRGQGLIKKILPRRNYVIRQSPRKSNTCTCWR
ncbi:MAG: ribosome small subunit-dependent GTPase A, partial [Saprospiraceae bacterium]